MDGQEESSISENRRALKWLRSVYSTKCSRTNKYKYFLARKQTNRKAKQSKPVPGKETHINASKASKQSKTNDGNLKAKWPA